MNTGVEWSDVRVNWDVTENHDGGWAHGVVKV